MVTRDLLNIPGAIVEKEAPFPSLADPLAATLSLPTLYGYVSATDQSGQSRRLVTLRFSSSPTSPACSPKERHR